MAASFFQTYKAEGIKLKNTFVYWLTLILTLIIPVIYIGFQLYELKEYNEGIYSNYKIFEIVFNDIAGSYLGFFYIITLILTTSRLAQVDFKHNTWQLVETLPTSKFNIYFSKFLRIFSILLFGLIVIIVLSILTALVLYAFIDNKENVSLSLPITDYLQYITKAIVASLFSVSVLFFVSTRFSNFIFTMLLGFGLIIAIPILKALGKLPKWEMYTLIGNVVGAKSDIGDWFTYSDYVSLCLAIPFLVVGYFWYKDRTFKDAFLKNKKQLLVSVLFIVTFVGLAIYFLQPKQQLPSNKTLVQGEILTSETINNVYLIDPSVTDTIGVAKIENNKYTINITKNLPLGSYLLLLDNKYQKDIYMATDDNIIANFSKKGDKTNFEILGTRIAENNLSFNPFNFKSVSSELSRNHKLEDTEYYFKNIQEEFDNNIDDMITTYTPDNFIPREDFLDLNKKNIAVNTLLLFQEYQEKYKLMFNKDLPQNTFITDLEKSIDLNDDTMVNNEEYTTYIKNIYIKQDSSNLDDETKATNAISKLKNSDFKDRLVYSISKNALSATKNIDKINQIENQFQNQFLNTKVKNNFIKNVQNAKRMALGQMAPNFVAALPNGQQVSLSDFAGKYVVIDVWATWCGPCKYQSPKFDKVANTYKNNNEIVFVALSVDEKIDKWLIDVKDKKVNVTQLIATNQEQFSQLYNITFIPRFILIGKNGELINSSLPFPDTDEFETEIQKLVKP